MSDNIFFPQLNIFACPLPTLPTFKSPCAKVCASAYTGLPLNDTDGCVSQQRAASPAPSGRKTKQSVHANGTFKPGFYSKPSSPRALCFPGWGLRWGWRLVLSGCFKCSWLKVVGKSLEGHISSWHHPKAS